MANDPRKIFVEAEKAHAIRLHGRNPFHPTEPRIGAQRQTKMRRWVLRLRREAHAAGHDQPTADELKRILDTNGTWDVCAMSMRELESWLQVRWNARLGQYEPR